MASSFIRACLPCVAARRTITPVTRGMITAQPMRHDQAVPFSDKAGILSVETPSPPPYSDDASEQFIAILSTANHSGPELEARLKSIVSVNGWTEHLAEAILRGVEKLIDSGVHVAKAMDEAVDKAEDAAWDFAKDHPYYTAAIAIGVLVLLAPWVIEALGFETLGPRAGSFAARWMSRIAKSEGHVTKGSFYAFLQRLGMTW